MASYKVSASFTAGTSVIFLIVNEQLEGPVSTTHCIQASVQADGNCLCTVHTQYGATAGREAAKLFLSIVVDMQATKPST